MKKQHLFEYRLFSAIFYTQQSKDVVIGIIVMSFWISLLLPLRDFVPLDNKGETCPPPPPPDYMVPKYPSVNKVNYNKQKTIWYQNTPV